jgi:hypothetical protein
MCGAVWCDVRFEGSCVMIMACVWSCGSKLVFGLGLDTFRLRNKLDFIIEARVDVVFTLVGVSGDFVGISIFYYVYVMCFGVYYVVDL